MNKKILVFDSHPVQYRAPVWRTIEQEVPGSIHVVYATDCSVKGHVDSGFGRSIAWDEPLLDGYAYSILNSENGIPLEGWNTLTGKGVGNIMDKIKPNVILLTGFNYRYDLVAYIQAKLRGIPVWVRCETQDTAVERSWIKGLVRSMIYGSLYKGLNRIFYIGALNKNHYLKLGVSESILRPAYYATTDRFKSLTANIKKELRDTERLKRDIDADKIVIGFSGKFISKKNPDIFYDMIPFIPEPIRSRLFFYYLGSGEMEQELKQKATQAFEQYGIRTYFAGFVNQTELASPYLAMDIMILPSRKMGETWGLVANEAMQAGCSVIVSNSVGSSANFNDWKQFRVFNEGDAKNLAKHLIDLTVYPRSFDWAQEGLKEYSIEKISDAFIQEMKQG